MRIRVHHPLLFKERSDLSQLSVHGIIGIKNKLSRKEKDILGKTAIVIDRTVDFQAILHSTLIVLLTVAGCGVDTSGSGIQGHIGSEDDERIPVEEGMPGFEPL
jgi:hypothetical protein